MHTRDLSRTENFGLSRGTSGFVKRSPTPDERKRTAAILREIRDEIRSLRLQLERRQA